MKNGQHEMAKAKVGAAGIEYIQGALKRPKKMNGHNHGNYLVATHRSAPTENPDCQRLYTFDSDRYKRSTPVTTEETRIRNRFSAVAAAVAAIAAVAEVAVRSADTVKMRTSAFIIRCTSRIVHPA